MAFRKKDKTQPTADRASLMLVSGEAVSIEAAAEGAATSPAKVRMVAYTGVPVVQYAWDHPIVIDLAGMKIPEREIPFRNSHSRFGGIGHGRASIEGGRIVAEGVVSRDTEEAREVTVSLRNGFPWQASIGASVLGDVDFIRAGVAVSVNGQQFTGPLYVARQSELYEISFVDIGADTNTEARIAAARVSQNGDGEADHPEVIAMADSDIQATGDKPVSTGKADTASVGDQDQTEAQIRASRERIAAEADRVASIEKVAGSNPAIMAQAVREGWTAEKAELECVRASRPAIHSHGPTNDLPESRIIEAGLLMHAKYGSLEKAFTEKELNAASQRFRHGIGPGELLLMAAQANGYTGRNSRDVRALFDHAFARGNVQASFSNVDIAGILSNTANKFLQEGFFYVEPAWRDVASIRAGNDFKTMTTYRLTGNDTYQKVAPAGNIQHGDLDETSYTNRIETYGLILGVTRQDIINDDLSALSTVPRKLGAGAGKKLNSVFWTEFEDNGSFFTTGRGNYIEGVTTNLGIAGLTAGETAFLDMLDTDGNPTGVMPRILLVPTVLSAKASQLINSLELRDTTASTNYGTANPFQNKFRVVSTRYLTGSDTAWYLLADPRDVPTIEVAFLNGNESPTVETAEADFNTLGIQMRGYHDFGVSLADYFGGLKSKGAS